MVISKAKTLKKVIAKLDFVQGIKFSNPPQLCMNLIKMTAYNADTARYGLTYRSSQINIFVIIGAIFKVRFIFVFKYYY